MKKLWAILALLFLGFIKGANAEYVIGSDDALAIKVYGYEDLSTETRVSDNGLMVFPLIGEIKIGGKSTLEAGRMIAQLLGSGGFIKNAQVTVVVLDYKSQQVSVLGQVNKPGQYTLDVPRTLIDVVAMAGGINPFGEDRVIITRHVNGKTVKEEIDLRKILEFPETSKVVAIEKGDIVYIPKAPMFYIQGEVQKPGSFRLEPNMTIAQAVSVGGGLTPRGTLNGIEVARQNPKGAAKTLAVRLTDPVLKDDVIVVDERLF
ncbi:MAG: polysaccharide export protein EpsE [Methylococcaceae bacterium]|nr:polysaccharide export protein EpsE [Methylococcaceae bacterium]